MRQITCSVTTACCSESGYKLFPKYATRKATSTRRQVLSVLSIACAETEAFTHSVSDFDKCIQRYRHRLVYAVEHSFTHPPYVALTVIS
ncbi:hypothetical protein PHSY_005587 [Pseudozyma hubeiensis SY62]|uniref:Uncharacterized protein n=1 Tax=Pseudozyma hubeiensis (strain SY62) TaxID=1305764 RepID=R9P9H3_PSEHS|nr:hypothetical protein PHSY_005587 [Pseudozyma hubeiensis SY62]GAC97999.1 hypothetical protein PHSY_005587 [Pseudozyma hubeiensis SY62]